MPFENEKFLDGELFAQNQYGEFISLGTGFKPKDFNNLEIKSNNWLKLHGYKMRSGRGKKYKNPWRMLVDHKQYSYTIKAVCE